MAPREALSGGAPGGPAQAWMEVHACGCGPRRPRALCTQAVGALHPGRGSSATRPQASPPAILAWLEPRAPRSTCSLGGRRLCRDWEEAASGWL